jgi:hypothetical protein
MRAVSVQIAYYQHWQRYGENDKISKKEIDVIIKRGLKESAKNIYNSVIKYNLTDADFIWDVLAISFELENKYELFRKFKKPPFNINLPPDNRDWFKRCKEIKGRGLAKTRKEMEDAYDKEGDDV